MCMDMLADTKVQPDTLALHRHGHERLAEIKTIYQLIISWYVRLWHVQCNESFSI